MCIASWWRPATQFSAESLDIYRQLQDSVHIAMVPRYYELISWRSRLTDLSGTPFLEIAQPHLSAWDRFMKRAFDLCISSAVLLVDVAAAPGRGRRCQAELARTGVLPPGPPRPLRGAVHGHQVPLHDHGRRGRAGRETRYPETDDPDLPLHELRNKKDETGRITRFGAFLRRTGIDEIPQFINVFKGDMSIVGPRPFVPSESNVEGWATRRFEVRPGITGLWQVSGRNDLTRNDLVQLDYLYVASWSLWWDLKIMFETPMTMVRGTGAY